MNLDNMTKTDIQECRKALALCPEAQAALDRAKACGVDCSDQQALLTLAQQALTQINQVYGPGFPAKSPQS
jgi:hypothetical protein